MPTARGSLVTSRPRTRTTPDEGRRRPHRILKVVDLPAPFGPTTPQMAPGATSNDSRSTATASPNRRVRSWTLMAAGGGCIAISPAIVSSSGSPGCAGKPEDPPALRAHALYEISRRVRPNDLAPEWEPGPVRFRDAYDPMSRYRVPKRHGRQTTNA